MYRRYKYILCNAHIGSLTGYNSHTQNVWENTGSAVDKKK